MPKVAITKAKLDSLAVKIAAKSGETLPLTLDEMGDAVDGISGGGANIPVFTVDYPNVTCNMTYAECRTYALNEDYDSFEVQNPAAVSVSNGYTSSMSLHTAGADYLKYVAYTDAGKPFGEINYFQNGTITLVEGSPDLLGTLNVTTNGTYDAPTNGLYNEVIVNVPSSQPTLQSKTNVTPTESSQTITPDTGYDALSSVQIDPISSSYVGSGVTRRSSTDLTASGATVTVPAGYYDSQASKAVASGTEGTPSATKGAVSNHQVSVTPSVTNGAGYIAGGSHSGTPVTVSASELVSGSETKTQNGTYDVTNLAELVVDVSGGGGVNIDTKTVTASNYPVSISFSSMKGEPKAFFLRSTSQITHSGSATYYYIISMCYDGADTTGSSFRIGSTRRVDPVPSGYSWSYSDTTLTLTSSAASRSVYPGAFYNGNYELVYIY